MYGTVEAVGLCIPVAKCAYTTVTCLPNLWFFRPWCFDVSGKQERDQQKLQTQLGYYSRTTSVNRVNLGI